MCKEIERFENEVTVKVASEERINAVKTLLSCGLDDKTITAKMAVQYNIPDMLFSLAHLCEPNTIKIVR